MLSRLSSAKLTSSVITLKRIPEQLILSVPPPLYFQRSLFFRMSLLNAMLMCCAVAGQLWRLQHPFSMPQRDIFLSPVCTYHLSTRDVIKV